MTESWETSHNFFDCLFFYYLNPAVQIACTMLRAICIVHGRDSFANPIYDLLYNRHIGHRGLFDDKEMKTNM